MAIQNYIGWPIGVNQVILDSSTIKLGDNALKVDELENGHKRSVMRGAVTPEEYSVVMDFNWVDLVGDTGKTELQLFYDWYKYRHKYGSVPFEFPKILYSPMSGIRVVDEHNAFSYVEYYKITSAIEGKKSGSCVEVTMTWRSEYGGTISIPTPLPAIQTIEAHNGYADFIFSQVSDTAPTSTMFTLYIDSTETTTDIIGFYYNNKKARVYFEPLPSTGQSTHTLRFELNYSGLTVGVYDYNVQFLTEDV